MADTRQFTDHNEIDGVNVYLEDKKLAESPEKNTVASTDYVLLKDTDGVPHKISKANMISVVKDAIGELLKSNDLGTSVNKVPALNASAFGSATVGNLASVLGGLLYVRTIFHGNKNTGETINLGNRYGIFFFGNAQTGSAFIYVKDSQGWSKIYGSSDLNIDNTTNIYTVGEFGFTGTISQFGSSSYE